MDSITQAALGAAIGEATLGKHIGNKGAVLGAIVATIPDLDVALYLFYDKFEMLSIHRGFSHSVVFSIIGAVSIAYVLQRMKWTKMVSYQKLWIFTWLALFTHMLLDTFTAYGTQLLLPFSDARIGFDSVNVVDPVYTIPLCKHSAGLASIPNQFRYERLSLAGEELLERFKSGVSLLSSC